MLKEESINAQEQPRQTSFEEEINQIRELISELDIEIPPIFQENKHFWFLLLESTKTITEIINQTIIELKFLKVLGLEKMIVQMGFLSKLITKLGIKLAVREINQG